MVGPIIDSHPEVPGTRRILAHAHGMDFPKLVMYEILANYEW